MVVVVHPVCAPCVHFTTSARHLGTILVLCGARTPKTNSKHDRTHACITMGGLPVPIIIICIIHISAAVITNNTCITAVAPKWIFVISVHTYLPMCMPAYREAPNSLADVACHGTINHHQKLCTMCLVESRPCVHL